MPDWVHITAVILTIFFAFSMGWNIGVNSIIQNIVKELLVHVKYDKPSTRRQFTEIVDTTGEAVRRNLAVYGIGFLVGAVLSVVGLFT